MKRLILLTPFLLSAFTLPGCSGQATDALANPCIKTAVAALDQAHQSLGSPAASDFDSLDKIAKAARSDIGKATWGDPDARLSTSILDGKIRVWASCGGAESTYDWAPSR